MCFLENEFSLNKKKINIYPVALDSFELSRYHLLLSLSDMRFPYEDCARAILKRTNKLYSGEVNSHKKI